MAEVDLLAGLVDVADILLREVLEAVDSGDLGNVVGVAAGRDGHDALLDGPEQEHRGRVDALALGDALQDGLEGALLVTQDRGERAVCLGHDAVLGLQGAEGLELREEVGVELELCRVSQKSSQNALGSSRSHVQVLAIWI